MKARFLAIAMAALAGGVYADINLPLGTYIYAGTVKNYRNEAMTADADETVRIQAVGEDGTILAESSVVEPDNIGGVNFRLEVPVSSVRTAKSAQIGDAPRCVVVSSSGARGAATERFPEILCSSCVTNCMVVWSEAVSYTNETGTQVVAVPQEYIDGISPLTAMSGRDKYDPFADWDGDGASNYAEYMAGTNPFDASDYLRVTGFSATSETALLSFEYVGGHLYALKSAKSLASPEWMTTEFKTSDADGAAGQTTIYAGGEDDVGEATLYVTPAAENPQMYFKVEVK